MTKLYKGSCHFKFSSSYEKELARLNKLPPPPPHPLNTVKTFSEKEVSRGEGKREGKKEGKKLHMTSGRIVDYRYLLPY